MTHLNKETQKHVTELCVNVQYTSVIFVLTTGLEIASHNGAIVQRMHVKKWIKSVYTLLSSTYINVTYYTLHIHCVLQTTATLFTALGLRFA